MDTKSIVVAIASATLTIESFAKPEEKHFHVHNELHDTINPSRMIMSIYGIQNNQAYDRPFSVFPNIGNMTAIKLVTTFLDK